MNGLLVLQQKEIFARDRDDYTNCSGLAPQLQSTPSGGENEKPQPDGPKDMTGFCLKIPDLICMNYFEDS